MKTLMNTLLFSLLLTFGLVANATDLGDGVTLKNAPTIQASSKVTCLNEDATVCDAKLNEACDKLATQVEITLESLSAARNIIEKKCSKNLRYGTTSLFSGKVTKTIDVVYTITFL